MAETRKPAVHPSAKDGGRQDSRAQIFKSIGLVNPAHPQRFCCRAFRSFRKWINDMDNGYPTSKKQIIMINDYRFGLSFGRKILIFNHMFSDLQTIIHPASTFQRYCSLEWPEHHALKPY